MSARRFVAVVVGLLLDAALASAGARGEADAYQSASTRDLVEVNRGLLTVRVEQAPLASVLDVIARASGVSIQLHATFDEAVTANLRGLPIDEGLRRILGTRSVVFVYRDDLGGANDPELVQVHVYADSALGADWRPPIPWSQPADVAQGRDKSRGAGREEAHAWRQADDRRIQTRSARESGLFDQVLAQEQDPSARAHAARTLGRMGGDEAVGPLAVSIVTDPDSAVREAAAWGLGQTWADSAVPPLAQALLDDRHVFVREAAAQALGETWSESAVEALALAARVDARRSVREHAVDALGKIGGPMAVDALVAALGDAHSAVRESAAAALGAIGSRQALDALVHISLADRNQWVRQSAERAAAKILGSD